MSVVISRALGSELEKRRLTLGEEGRGPSCRQFFFFVVAIVCVYVTESLSFELTGGKYIATRSRAYRYITVTISDG